MGQPRLRLVSLKVSPWSERARWALDHHGLEYDIQEHTPILGERRLRRIVGPSKPRATVPVLITSDSVLTDSWDIAKYADRVGGGAKLIPAAHELAIKEWTERADAAMRAGRGLLVVAMLANPASLDANGPPAIPRWLRPFLRPVARRATMAFARKYELKLEAHDEANRAVRSALDALRDGLRASAPHLLGTFTYADIALATMMQGITPVADRFWPLDPATRAVWTRQPFAAEYADLVAWRDKLYDAHRFASSSKRLRDEPAAHP